MPTLRLTGGSKPATRTTRSKPAATRSTRTPARKPAAAKQAPTRKAPAARKPAAKAAASTNGGERGPKLPEGMTQGQFNKLVAQMQKARAIKEEAADALEQAQKDVNEMALELLQEGVQMSVISRELVLSRQWMYKLMKENNLVPANAKRNSRTTRAKKPAAKPAAKKTAARKRPAPARRRPPAPATTGRGRVRIAR